MKETYILSGKTTKPCLVDGRLEAVQVMERHISAESTTDPGVLHDRVKGNSTIRAFVEGSTENLCWGGFRLDRLDSLTKESK